MSEHKQIRHLGIYRTGITPEQAAIDNKILRILFRGSLTEGILRNRLTTSLVEMQESLQRLEGWDCIEVLPAHYGNARKVVLTPRGQGWALDLVSQRQLTGVSEPE